MKFSNLISLVAMSVIASGTWAQGFEGSAEPTGTVILNNNNNNNNNASSAAAGSAAVAQPTTIVEAAPVAPSKADLLRKSRLEAEVQTEQRVVEKIEDSRLQDEQRRAERLFGDRLNSNENTNINANVNTNTATAVVVAPVAPVAPVAVVPVVTTPPPAVVVHPAPPAPVIHEVTEVREELIVEHKDPLLEYTERTYIGLGVGSSVYNADNVDSSYSLGLTVGRISGGNVAVEGLFNYADHNINTYWQNPIYRQMSQYDFGVGLKYYLTHAWTVRPYFGGQMIYSYRVYTDRVLDMCYSVPACNPYLTEESTHALNLGWSMGMDVAVNRDFLIGADLKYNYNFIRKSDFSEERYGLPVDRVPLEELNYYTLQITGKMTF